MDANLPAGLEDFNVEAYRKGTKVAAIYGGIRFMWHDLPAECKEPFAVELIKDEKALKCLRDDMGIAASEIEEKFVWCRYGQCNSIPDYHFGKDELIPDAPGCEHEQQCPGFGIVCIIPGGLTRQEYFIVRHVVRGRTDKEIADYFGIQITTVRTHIQRVHAKLHINNRIELFMWAQRHGIQ